MSELRAWILANLPEGAEIFEASSTHFMLAFGPRYLVTSYGDRTTVSGDIPIVSVGSDEWWFLQSALAFAARIEEKRRELESR